jgi:hypothetical protein
MGNSNSAPEPEEHKQSFQQIRNVLAADTETFSGGNLTSEAPYDVNKVNQPYYKEYMEAKNKYLAIKNLQKGGAVPGPANNTMYIKVKDNAGVKALEYDNSVLQRIIPGDYRIIPVTDYERNNHIMTNIDWDLWFLDHLTEAGMADGNEAHVELAQAFLRLTANGTNTADLRLLLNRLKQ